MGNLSINNALSIQAILAGILRHIITAAGGAGALEGMSSSDPLVTTISVVTFVGGLAWSAIKNFKQG